MSNPQASTTFGEQSRKVMQDVQELGGIAAGNVGQAAARLGTQGEELLDGGKERVQKLQGDLERYISEHPMKSLLMALGVGALVGYLLKR